MPSQWVPVWFEAQQRWYFAETTGRSQWDAPFHIPAQPAYGDHSSGTRGVDPGYGGAPAYGAAGAAGAAAAYSSPPPGQGYASPPPQGYGAPPGAPYGQEGYPQEEKKKDNSTRNMMLGAAGGLAVGAVGGALIADALSM